MLAQKYARERKKKNNRNYTDSEEILFDQEKDEKVTKFIYLRQTMHIRDTKTEEIYAGVKAAWSCFGKKKKKKKKERKKERTTSK